MAMIHPTSEELASLYRNMPEGQLLEIAREYETLTETAQSALRAEFSSRKLEPPERLESIAKLEAQQVAVVGRYRDLVQAQMAKSVLESAGISCFLRDENTIRIDWGWSNLLGGIRLQVAAFDRESAEQILAQPAPDVIPIDGGEPFEQPRCPHCGSADIDRFWLGDEWTCQACHAVWRDTLDD